MKQRNSYDYPLLIVFGFIFFFIYIIQYTDGVSRESAGSIPQLMLPAAIFCGMYWDDKIGAIFGLVLGSLVDAVSANTICYNSIILMLMGYISGVLITKIINNNFRASLILTLGSALVYYFGYWCINGFKPQYLSQYYIKLVFLTVVASIPLYWGMKLIIGIRKKMLPN